MRFSKKLLLPALVGALALGACDDLSTGTNASSALAGGRAEMSILLTDAPGDLQAAVVTITDIYLQGDSGRVYLMQDSSVTTDLLKLSSSVQSLVRSKTIPSGEYSQLRFVISGAYIKVEKAGGGSTIYATSSSYAGLPAGTKVDGELKCPSCSKSGFKVILPGGDDDEVQAAPGSSQTILVDFDVAQSFGKPAGNSGKWILKPTLKATQTTAPTTATTTVTLTKAAALNLPAIGGVATTLGLFKVTATPAVGGEAKTATFTDANADGTFEATFTNLTAGSYALAIVGPAGLTFTTNPASPQTITVGASGTVTSGFQILTATTP